MNKEIKRIIIYLFLLMFYASSEFGMVVGILHFFIGFIIPKYSMSKVIMYMVELLKENHTSNDNLFQSV